MHAQVDPAALGGSPSHALTAATRIRNRVERTLTGRVQYVDNLADALTTASGDALYAEALYIMLAVPGALVGLGLAYLAALGAAERERRELALLRARGASRSRLLGLAAVESLALGLVAGILGAAAALGALRLVVPDALGLSPALVGAAVAVCVATAFAGALRARLAAGARVLTARSSRAGARCSAPASRSGSASTSTSRRWRQRARLLVDRPHRLLGGRQSRLEPDALARGLHVPRPRAAVDRRGAAAHPPARPRLRLACRARAATSLDEPAGSCWRAPAAAAPR